MRLARVARWMAAALAASCAPAAPAAGDDLSFVKGLDTPFPTETAPVETIVHDVDGDGAPDVVVPTGTQFRIWWGRADGTGALDPGPVVSAPDGATVLEVVNVDGDGDVDVVAAGAKLQVFKQSGVRTFGTTDPAIDPGAGGPTVHGFEGIDSGDLDGDGAMELAVTVQNRQSGFEQGHVRVLENDGNGAFSYDATYSDPDEHRVGEIVVGRFDNTPGPQDLAYRWSDFGGGHGVRVLLDDPADQDYAPGPSTPDLGQAFASTYGFLDTADLNGDGRGDLLAPGSVEVGWGTDAGTFTVQTLDADSEASHVFAAQMAGDPKLDVVATGTRLRVFTQGAPMAFTTGIDLAVPAELAYVSGDGGDFDTDPRDDLVVSFDGFDADGDHDLWVLLTRNPGSPSPFPAPPGDPPPADGGGTDPPADGGGPGPTFEPPVTPPVAAPPQVGGPQIVLVPVRAGQIALLPGKRRCGSRRRFRIRLRRPPEGVTVTEARVLVNGRRVAVRRGARLTAPVDLRGLPRGRLVVTIRITLADGRVLRGRRVYRPCARRKRGSRRFPRSRG